MSFETIYLIAPGAIWFSLGSLAVVAIVLVTRRGWVPRVIGCVIGAPVAYVSLVLAIWVTATWYEDLPDANDLRYFRALCKARAGDKIVKTVTDVDGILLMRPMEDMKTQLRRRSESGDYEQFEMEDAYFRAVGQNETVPSLFFHPRNSRSGAYAFFEMAQEPVGALRQFYLSEPSGRPPREGQPDVRLRVVLRRDVTTHQARYGYTWQDISTREMREKWIAGGKTTIFDLATGEVLGERTGFVIIQNPSRRKQMWRADAANKTCPEGAPRAGFRDFILGVLKPPERSAQSALPEPT